MNLVLNDSNIKEFEKAVNDTMDKCIKHFERDLIAIRTGRAHPSLVEDVKVTCYGSATMKLKELAAISTPEARMIAIQPWDKGVLGDIEKALLTSDLGITPVNDGSIIRITLPQMTTQRREELIKVLGRKLEESRVSIRNERKVFHNFVRDAQKNKQISEDHERRLNESLQKLTDKFIQTVENLAAKKENEIRII